MRSTQTQASAGQWLFYLLVMPVRYMLAFTLTLLVILLFQGVNLSTITPPQSLRWLTVVAIISWTGTYLVHARDIWTLVKK